MTKISHWTVKCFGLVIRAEDDNQLTMDHLCQRYWPSLLLWMMFLQSRSLWQSTTGEPSVERCSFIHTISCSNTALLGTSCWILERDTERKRYQSSDYSDNYAHLYTFYWPKQRAFPCFFFSSIISKMGLYVQWKQLRATCTDSTQALWSCCLPAPGSRVTHKQALSGNSQCYGPYGYTTMSPSEIRSDSEHLGVILLWNSSPAAVFILSLCIWSRPFQNHASKLCSATHDKNRLLQSGIFCSWGKG